MKACPHPFCGQPIDEHKASECPGTYEDEVAEENEAARLRLLKACLAVEEANERTRAVVAQYPTARHAWGVR